MYMWSCSREIWTRPGSLKPTSTFFRANLSESQKSPIFDFFQSTIKFKPSLLNITELTPSIQPLVMRTNSNISSASDLEVHPRRKLFFVLFSLWHLPVASIRIAEIMNRFPIGTTVLYGVRQPGRWSLIVPGSRRSILSWVWSSFIILGADRHIGSPSTALMGMVEDPTQLAVIVYGYQHGHWHLQG